MTPPLKLCFISPLGHGLFHPESRQPFGGAEVQFFLLSHELAADPALRVIVLTTVGGEGGIEQRGPLTLVARRGRGRLSSDAGGRLRGYAGALADMRRTLRAIDADVYFHAGAGVEVGAYALICRSLRRRFVFVVASSSDLADRPPLVRGSLRWLYPLGLRMADAGGCRTEEQRAVLRDRWGREGTIIRTGHPVPAESEAPPAAKVSILWAGRLHPLKQPELFLDLAECLPKERFVMAASRDAEQPELLRAVRRRAAGLPNVSLLEDVPWDRIGRCFQEAKVVVNTSVYEGFPNTFVQAALHGTPIVSWTVDPDSVLTRHRIGFCAGGSFERLAAGLEELCAHEPVRLELGRQARAYAVTHHDVKQAAQDFKALCRSLPARRGG